MTPTAYMTIRVPIADATPAMIAAFRLCQSAANDPAATTPGTPRNNPQKTAGDNPPRYALHADDCSNAPYPNARTSALAKSEADAFARVIGGVSATLGCR